MNQGQYNALMAQLTKLSDSLDEIRRGVNRMDARLKEHKRILYVPPDADIAALVKEHDLHDAIIFPLPSASQVANAKPPAKQPGPTDPQAQMREQMAKRPRPRPMPKTEG